MVMVMVMVAMVVDAGRMMIMMMKIKMMKMTKMMMRRRIIIPEFNPEFGEETHLPPLREGLADAHVRQSCSTTGLSSSEFKSRVS